MSRSPDACQRTLFGGQRLGIVAHHGEIAQPSFDALGDRDLRGDTAENNLRGGVNPMAGQSVYDVVPCPRLGLIERLRRLGAALAGQHRHDRKVRV